MAEIPERLGEIPIITYNVMIPLKRAAIQIKLMGPVDRGPEIKLLLREILDGLQGESNWSQRNLPEISDSYRIILLTAGILFVLGGLAMLYFISKRTPKGTALGLAFAIYLASWTIQGTHVREILVLTGTMRMLGFAGIILGLVDTVRKRPPRVEIVE
jgi:hypothetical protein